MLEIHKHTGTSTNFQAEKTKTSLTLKTNKMVILPFMVTKNVHKWYGSEGQYSMHPPHFLNPGVKFLVLGFCNKPFLI